MSIFSPALAVIQPQGCKALVQINHYYYYYYCCYYYYYILNVRRLRLPGRDSVLYKFFIVIITGDKHARLLQFCFAWCLRMWLQRVQKYLAYAVTRSRPFAHAVPLLQPLHWHPINFRIDFKLTLSTLTPPHTLVPTTPSRTLRSHQDTLLNVPIDTVRTATGSRAFGFCAPASVELPSSVTAVPGFNSCLQNETENSSVWPVLYPP